VRILVVHPRMRSLGGAEQVAIHSLVACLKAGHRVSLISENFDIQGVEDFFGCKGLFDNVERLSFPAFNPLVGKGLLLYQQLYYYQRETRKLLSRDSDFDLVLSTQDVGYVPSTNLPTIQYCYFPDYFSHIPIGKSSTWWGFYYWPARRFYRDCVRRVDRFLSVSDFTRDFIRKIWGREAITLYPPCPIEPYRTLDRVREDLVLTVGRIVPGKRLEDFVEIARELPRVKFIVIGTLDQRRQDYYNSLRTRMPANLSFILSPLRIAVEALAKAKVYVHCAQSEQFGITIVEAMAAGCVPVVHDSGGPREIVTSEVGFRWETVSQAVSHISHLMDNETMWRGLSRSASSRATLFSPEVFESKMIEIVESENVLTN
jgi:alpha-1,2-mannosyltransferase